MRLSLDDARRLAIASQRLAGRRVSGTRSGMLSLVRDIGYLQLDPTNVVARNPLLVLFSRVGPFDPALLESLHRRRDVFETISLIVPSSDLHIHGVSMRRYRQVLAGRRPAGQKWVQRAVSFYNANPELRRRIMARLRREGPLPLSAFEDRAPQSWTYGEWNDENNVHFMLVILQRRGEIVVTHRQRGQKAWGLAEWSPTARPLPESQVGRECARRALRAMGLGTFMQLRSQYAFGSAITQGDLDTLERAGEIERVEVEGGKRREAWYALAGVTKRLGRVNKEWTDRTVLLSPFDNLIIDRERTERLYGMRYRMEIYVPKHLRVRGFWAMPILQGSRVIGTLDPSFDRERKEMTVNTVRLEPGVRGVDRAVRGAVQDLATFVGAHRIVWP